mmetsp:Transcript_43708/g.132323  ORF Transcript_43708/g.132323 Transcript_43708/m.132323 type:complete len:313 (+) Transcript_43708:212-1150(+)
MQARHFQHLAVHGLARDENDEAGHLQVAVIGPDLTERRVRVPVIMHREPECPDQHGARRVQHHAVHSRQALRHRDAGGVERCAREEEEQHDVHQRHAVLEQIPRVDGVLHVAMIVTRDEPEQRVRDEEHNEGAPRALEANDPQGGQVDVLHEELLGDDLRRLHDLPGDHQGHADEHVRRAAAGGRVAADAGQAHQEDARDAEGEAHPVEAEHLPLQEGDGEDRGEDDGGTPEHLPDAGWDVQHADGGQRRREDVKSAGDRYQANLLRVGKAAAAAVRHWALVDHQRGGLAGLGAAPAALKEPIHDANHRHGG